jgi:hypothetical protein
MIRIKFAVILVLVTILSACWVSRESIPATSCFLIEVEDDPEKERIFDYGRQLLPIFNSFAVAHELNVPSREASGGAYDYKNPEMGLMMILTFGAGERRALSAIYVDPEMSCSICDDFEKFMVEQVGQTFTVINCDDEEGFGGAVLYGANLRKG